MRPMIFSFSNSASVLTDISTSSSLKRDAILAIQTLSVRAIPQKAFCMLSAGSTQRQIENQNCEPGGAMKPLKRQFGNEMDGGVSYTLRAGPGAKPYIDIGVSWTIHSDREASLQICWGGRPMTSIDK